MNGVMIPEVSAGSNHVGASEMWTAQVICPADASVAPLGETADIKRAKTRNGTKRPRTLLMGSLPVFGVILLSASHPRRARRTPHPRHGSGFLDRLRATPDHGQHRHAVLRRHRVHAAVRPVVHAAGGHGTGFVRVGALDDVT